ncbi:MAG: hypothetical protein K9M75_09160 [Phycisphaerae bacterium]|nr:hypothetical protein [Phycisphaerae bacterium]
MLFVRLYGKHQTGAYFLNCFSRILPVVLLLFLIVGVVQAEFIADGVKLTPLTDDGKSLAMLWSYNSDMISFARYQTSSQGQLMIMKSDGTGEEAVTQIGNPIFAEWSWDGTKLSYEFSNADNSQSQGGVFIYDLATKKSKAISSPYPEGCISADDGPFFSADNKYVAYKVLGGASKKRQLWVTDTESGRFWRILADRGQILEHKWSPLVPPRLSMQLEASAGHYDIATVDPEGKDLILLTDIDAQSIRTDEPRWSPTGEWVAFGSDVDMTQTERQKNRGDCWVARPDGSEAKNLTNASSPATEKQLNIDDFFWSWDGKWILVAGNKFDNQGSAIPAIFLIDPVSGGRTPLMTSFPRKTGEIEFFKSIKWSYDNSKILILKRRYDVKNWGPDPEYENSRWYLSIYDFLEKTTKDLLVYSEQFDRKMILGHWDRDTLEDISWSPDNRSILLTIAKIISKEDDIYEPDIYRLDLPERFISATASRHIGPPIRRTVIAGNSTVQTTVQVTSPETAAQSERVVNLQGNVTEVIKPQNMTVSEVIESLPADYNQYITVNSVRNIMLFKGPAEVLEEMKADLNMVDTEAPHLLVDLMAVELTEEANRNLGLDWAYADGHFALAQPVGRPLQNFSQTTNLGGFPSGARDTLTSLPGMGQAFYQGVGDLPREFFMRLNTLVKDGEGTILANPRTVAMSGKESLINIRKTLNYFFNEGFDTSGRPIVKKSDISADTEGRIVPTLLANGKIHLKVEVKVGNFTFTDDAGLPELTTRLSNTEVTVKEGQTLVLGGLRQQEMGNVTSKVPVLGDIPVIGGLFKHEETETKHSVLTIFITPHSLKPGDAAPKWPQLDINEHKIIPIMGNGKRPKTDEIKKRQSDHKIERKHQNSSIRNKELSPEETIEAWLKKMSKDRG